MNRKYILLCLFLSCLIIHSFAREVSSEQGSHFIFRGLNWEYKFMRDQVQLGYTARLIEQGVPLHLQMRLNKYRRHISESESLKQEMERAMEEYSEEIRRIQNQRELLREGAQGQREEFSADQEELLSGKIVYRWDSEELTRCLKGSEGLLQEALTLEQALADSEEVSSSMASAQHLLMIVKAQLENQRIEGGLICGQYLPASYLFKDRELIEEMKILKSLINREDEEQRLLWKTYLLAHHPEGPLLKRPFWNWIWLKMSLLAAFGEGPLVSMDELVKELSGVSIEASSELQLVEGWTIRLQYTEEEALKMLREGDLFLQQENIF